MHFLFVAITFFLFISIGQSQPAPRHLEEVAYDMNRNRLILFGGVELEKEQWIEPASVQEWDGSKWTICQAAGPIGRRAGAMVYDESSRETFLFGGVSIDRVHPDSVYWMHGSGMGVAGKC